MTGILIWANFTCPGYVNSDSLDQYEKWKFGFWYVLAFEIWNLFTWLGTTIAIASIKKFTKTLKELEQGN